MRRLASLAAALAVLSAFPAAAAVRKTTAAPVARAAPAPAPAPAPEPAPAAAPASGGFQLKDISIAGYIGGEFGDLDGVYLRADASAPLMALTPKIDLLGVLSLGYTHLGTGSGTYGVTWNMVKVTASARAQMELAPKLEGFADAGLGFYYGGFTSTIPWYDPITFQPTTLEVSDSAGGFTMRFAVGGLYEISPKLKLAAELGLNPYFGDAETTNFFIGVGAEYKL